MQLSNEFRNAREQTNLSKNLFIAYFWARSQSPPMVAILS